MCMLVSAIRSRGAPLGCLLRCSWPHIASPVIRAPTGRGSEAASRLSAAILSENSHDIASRVTILNAQTILTLCTLSKLEDSCAGDPQHRRFHATDGRRVQLHVHGVRWPPIAIGYGHVSSFVMSGCLQAVSRGIVSVLFAVRTLCAVAAIPPCEDRCGGYGGLNIRAAAGCKSATLSVSLVTGRSKPASFFAIEAAQPK